ncbi:T9SS type A sorting domain-containing protein [Winogradskyella sp. F6397]|uniref:T9SS type A sorting domain-containing protein n=1 Tax=Winogradskyella marina TaxID=2785530 RepID=A0ABS0EL88_9FLAO|nr:T9SS type A sorting domain-containing protein [Winogradskyella marina]MBF8150180.1 T9SS type A sorting domain-containing protein [Winogradskyella marina]
MKKMTLFILALSLSAIASAQITVTGIVTNDSIQLESASVMIKNSTNGIATNNKGEFKLEAKKGDTLSVSYLGYESKELVVNSDKYLTVKLIEGGSLEEVVINGYFNYRIGCSGMFSEVKQIVDISNEKKLNLFPNPSSNGIFQLMLVNNYSNVSISIADMSGKIIQNTTQQKFGKKGTIDLSTYPTGIYIVNIIADGSRLEPIKAIKS